MVAAYAAEILQLWEDNRERDPLSRSVALSATADPMLPFAATAALAIGERNLRMLHLRQRWTADDFEITAQCPNCQSQLEFTVNPSRLIDAAEQQTARPRTPVTVGDTTIHWRALTTRDLMAAASQAPDAEQAGRALVDRCIEEVTESGVVQTNHEPSDAERNALAEAIEAADPLCDVRFELGCVECKSPVTAGLSLTDTVWSELERKARSLVSEVHQLAAAYGWTESECLALSPQRRASYLEWVGAS
jgi:hypothetical protein